MADASDTVASASARRQASHVFAFHNRRARVDPSTSSGTVSGIASWTTTVTCARDRTGTKEYSVGNTTASNPRPTVRRPCATSRTATAHHPRPAAATTDCAGCRDDPRHVRQVGGGGGAGVEHEREPMNRRGAHERPGELTREPSVAARIDPGAGFDRDVHGRQRCSQTRANRMISVSRRAAIAR